ncbi:MAG: hypothetical protein KTR32_31635 [Granulosicoccus sp.]|nr:hypothetical protein [Granulosicoccus sp.]
MDQLDRFIEHHRKRLILFLEQRRNIPANKNQALEFVDQVLDDWNRELRESDIPPLARAEMTFWFSLYKLESLAEIPLDRPILPFEQMMFETAEQCLSLLSHRQPLPVIYYASRPTHEWTDRELSADEICGSQRFP